jgi:hypothetical protein
MMNDETTPPEPPAAEAPPEEGAPEPPRWEYKEEFAIHTQMKAVISKTLDVTVSEIDKLKLKLDKLTYGA